MRVNQSRRRKLYIVLIALLVAVIAGSGLLYAFLAPKGTSTLSQSNVVVGNVRFLSSPNAASGSINEVELTVQHIPNPPVGEQYYAWLQTGSEDISPIHWALTPRNGSLSSLYTNPHLLTVKPYQLLITAEKMDSGVPTFDSNARLYYANLQSRPIQNSTSFPILQCPQNGSHTICMS